MPTTLATLDLDALVSRAVHERVPDADRSEIDAFTSCLRSSLGLRAINLAFEAKRAGNLHDVDVFVGRGLFDLEELPRRHLVEQLVHTSGFDSGTCDAILGTIEKPVNEQLRRGESVEIDALGIVEPSGASVRLILAEELRVNMGSGA